MIAAILTLGAASTAQGADLIRKAAPAPVSNWSGWYAGLNVGGGWGKTDVGYAPNDALMAFTFSAPNFFPISANGDRNRSSGALGGIQVGYNYQFASRLVAGFEADFQGAGIDGSGTTSYLAGQVSTTASQSIDYFGTVRARLGYLASDRLLIYATGGFAYAHLNNVASTSTVPNSGFAGGLLGPNGVPYTFACGSINAAPDLCFSGASNGITPGWTVGGGLEYALGQKWSVKGEYLFAHFKETVNAVAITSVPGTTPASYSANFTTNLNIVRIGLNYKFGG
ncbi:MAG: outer membrane beta-barrel protein [Afipia sp.]|nr:outer membrane beta-barrel protein [Afipia sp.]